MTSRFDRWSTAREVIHATFAELLAEWDIQVDTCRVEILFDALRNAYRVSVVFKYQERGKVLDWIHDEDYLLHMDRALLESYIEQFATDACFPIELPEWQLLNLL